MVPGELRPFEMLQSEMRRRICWPTRQQTQRIGTCCGRISHDILNILEDGYIENRMLLDYPGILGSSLRACAKTDSRIFLPWRI